MSDRSKWHIPPAVTVNNEPWHPLKSVLFLAGFIGLCAAIVVWRNTLGRL